MRHLPGAVVTAVDRDAVVQVADRPGHTERRMVVGPGRRDRVARAQRSEREREYCGAHLLAEPVAPGGRGQERRRVHGPQPYEVLALQPLVTEQLTTPEDAEAELPRLGAPPAAGAPVVLVHDDP